MVTRKIGPGIIVSSGDPVLERAKPDAKTTAHAPADFFTAHGVSQPSALFDAMADTFYFAKDINGRFVWSNQLLQKKHGIAHADDIIGKCDHDFLRRDIADRVRADDLAVMSGEGEVTNKLEVIGDENGLLSWLCTTKTPLRDRQGQVIGIEGVSRDVLRARDIVAPYHAFKDAMEYLQRNFTKGISIEELARLSCMSLSTFERKFKQYFSISPTQYILNMRVQEACRRLPGHQSIAQVAVETGFGGQSYFTKQFSSVVGITPKQYRLTVSRADAKTGSQR